jgi:peptide/nickel transport system ATP-binding protein
VLYAGRMAESGNAKDVFESPQHPYTKGLIASIPTLKSTKIAGIEGFMPDLANLPPGCKFYPRCPYVMEVCKKDEPQLRSVRESQLVACWLY